MTPISTVLLQSYWWWALWWVTTTGGCCLAAAATAAFTRCQWAKAALIERLPRSGMLLLNASQDLASII